MSVNGWSEFECVLNKNFFFFISSKLEHHMIVLLSKILKLLRSIEFGLNCYHNVL